jgi:hypothetical protein
MKAIWIAAALALSLGTVACGGGEGACKSGCKKAADCDYPDGYEYDQDECEKGCEKAAEAADKADCKSEFNKAAKCAKKNFDCEADGSECEDEYTDYGKCLAE